MKAFKEWDEVKDMIDDGSIDDNAIKEVLVTCEIKGNKMDFEEFVEVFEELQDIADGETDDDEDEEDEDSYEEALQEAFDELKGKDGKVTVKAFKEWEEVQALIEEDGITEKDIQTALSENEIKGNKLDFEQFTQIMDTLQDMADDNDIDDDETDGEDDEDEDSMDTSKSEELESDYRAALQEAFDELKGKDGKVTVKAFKEWEEVKEVLQEGR